MRFHYLPPLPYHRATRQIKSCRDDCSCMRGQSPRRIVGGILTERQNGIVCLVRQRRTHFEKCSKHVRRIATSGRAWGKAGGITPPITPPHGGVVAGRLWHTPCGGYALCVSTYRIGTTVDAERETRTRTDSPLLRNHPAIRRGYVRFSATRVNPRASARGYTSDDLRGLLS